MLWPLKGKAPGLGVGLIGLLLLAGCGSSDRLDTGASAATAAPAAARLEETLGEVQAMVIDPPRLTQLMTPTPGAQINLRSQPTTLSPILGSGAAGDEVRLLRLAEGEGGHTWYYAQSPGAEREGWVRGDFVDISTATAPAASTAAVESSALTTDSPCGSDRQEAFFETQSYRVSLCKTVRGLRYVGTHKTTQEALITEDVAVNQSIYIAINGNQQYHISDTHLALYEIHNGSYTPLASEPVLRFERFVY
jgi:hypothetical protein